MKRNRIRTLLVVAALPLALNLAACGGSQPGEGPAHRVTIPPGASFSAVADSLEARDIVGSPTFFRLYARLVGAADGVQAGTYEFREGAGYRHVLDDLTAGRIAADRLVLPEGYQIQQIVPALAELVPLPADSIVRYMLDTATASRFGVPGPTLEGYLYPATYIVPAGAPLDSIIGRMVQEHMRRWTQERQARADSAGFSHREVVTLASIVEKEARVRDEMQKIAAVYRNRLEIGYALQADPTVQYALGEHQNRLLYSHIESVADHPYNTYEHPGVPPGPIGAPSDRAIDAVLDPADVDYLYFVARPDGTHVFNRHLVDHNRAKARIRQERTAQGRAAEAQDKSAPASR
ncbi:MAG: endolytic transglycosylase MltG [Gemmatimonadota bacterium]